MKKNIILPILFVVALALDVHAQWSTVPSTSNIYNTAGGLTGINNNNPQARLHINSGSWSIALGETNGTSSPALGWTTGYMGLNMYNSGLGTWKFGTDGSHNGGNGMFSTIFGVLNFVTLPSQTSGGGDQNLTDAQLLNNVTFQMAPWGNYSSVKFRSGKNYQTTTLNALPNGMSAAHNYGVSYLGFNAEDDGTGWYLTGDGTHNGGAAIIGTIFGDLRFYSAPSESGSGHAISNSQMAGDLALRINSASILSLKPVQIGSTAIPAGYTLSADGKVICEEVTVKLKSTWPDYVFNKEHQLPSLRSVNNYIQENGRLPEMPSAAEVSKNGIDVGAMNASLLKKIEELTLYVIELEKVNDEQSKVLKTVLEKLEKLK